MALTAASPSSQRAAAQAYRLLAQEETWARGALTRSNKAWWQASISGKTRDYTRMEAAERAINRHYSRAAPYQQVTRLLSTSGLDPLLHRRLQRLQNAYRGMQAPRDLLDRMTALSAHVQEAYSTFRGVFEGQPCSDNVLEDVLRTTTDNARARAAWEARKQIGPAVADDVRRLAELRNEAARAVGFPDFWHQQLTLEELDPARLLATLEEVDRQTAAPFRAMKRELDQHLAERFGVAPADLRPWHYGNPFFQEAPEVFAPPADPLYAQRDVVALGVETYHRLGFPTIDAIIARSDLYPRPGKNQHAFAMDVDREGDVRTLQNVEPNAYWMGTLLHELGHTIYQDGLDRVRLPYDLRDDPQGFLNEGFAMFCEQPMFDPVWLSQIVDVNADEAQRLAPRLLTQDTASLLAFIRWCLTIVHFEQAFYADPAQDLNTLWWHLVKRYQEVTLDGRNSPDWATKIHVATAPVYYHKYLYGRLFSAQLTEKMNALYGGWWEGGETSGQYVKQQMFTLGATYAWPELVQRLTGEPLGVHALARAVAWPQRLAP